MTDSRSNSRHTPRELSKPVNGHQAASNADSQGVSSYQSESLRQGDSDEWLTNPAHIRHTDSADSTHGNPFAEIYDYSRRLLEKSTFSAWAHEDTTDDEWKIRYEERARIFGDVAADIDDLTTDLVQRLQ